MKSQWENMTAQEKIAKKNRLTQLGSHYQNDLIDNNIYSTFDA